MPEIKDTDWAYAAGFVDGEGREVLDWFHELWGGWVVQMPQPGGKARRSWAWRSPTGTSAEPFLRGILGWLRLKQSQCENALEMIEVLKRSRRTLGPKFLPPEWLETQEQHYWRQRELNHRGSDQYVAKPMHSPRKIHRERQRLS